MRILFPLGCLAELDHIYPWAQMFLNSHNSRLIFVHVSPPGFQELGKPAVWVKSRDNRQPYRVGVVAMFKERSDQIDVHLHIGSPASEIVKLAHRNISDLILIYSPTEVERAQSYRVMPDKQ